MRSRYVAYAEGEQSYLRATWHPSTRPDSVPVEQVTWTGLDILATEAGGPADTEGTVEFIACFIAHGRPGALHETSRFVREKDQWYYLDGDIHADEPVAAKVGRNDACPCGSGLKFKRCCGV